MNAPATSATLGAVQSEAKLSLAGYGGVAFQITSTFVGTVTFEGSVDGFNFSALLVTPIGSTTQVTTATSTGIWFGTATGLLVARARMSAYTSGAAVVHVKAVQASPGSSSSGGGGGGDGTSSDFGAAFPTKGTAAGVSDPDGTMQPVSAETFDFDTGAGTVLVTALGIALPSSGGPVAGGTSSNPLVVTPAASTLANGQVTVDTTSGGVEIVAARSSRRCVTIVNKGTTDVYLGAGSVSTANGVLLVGIVGAAVSLATTAQVKGIVGSGSQSVAYIEEYA